MRENRGRVICEARTCSKSAGRSGAKHISKSRVQKTEGYGALLDDFGRSYVVSCGTRKVFGILPKASKTWSFFNSILKKTTAGVGLLNGRRNTREMFIRDVRRSGR